MATALSADRRAAVIARANELASKSGLSPEQVLHTYGVSEGLSNSDIDTMMGFESGSSDKWLASVGGNRGNINQQAADLGFSTSVWNPAPQSKQEPLSAERRAAVIARANELASKSGRTPEQELHAYAMSEGLSNSDIDTMMGFPTGSSDKWIASEASKSNLGLGGNYTAAQTYTPNVAGPAQQAGSQGYAPTLQGAPSTAETHQFSAAQTGPVAQAAGASYSPTMLGNASTYNATRANLGLGLQSLGSSDPTQANAQLLSGKVNNPYLDAQADNITKRLNRNLQENILPGIGQGATMAGQYGGSRQGIAQGKAIGDTNDNLANALTNMYSGANEAAQGRMAGAAGSLSGIGASLESQNASAQNQAGQFNAGAQNTFSMANQSAANQAGQYNAGLTAQNNQFNAGQYNQNQQFNTSAQNAANSQNSSAANNMNQFNAGAQNNFGLANQSASNQASQFGAAAGNAASLYNAGATNSQNQYNAGLQNQAGQFNAGATNSYNLGLRSSDLGYANLDANIAQNNFNNQLAGANFGLNVYNTLGQQNNAGTQAATNIQNAPLVYQNNASNAANAAGGQGGTTSGSTLTQSDPYLGFVAGAQVGQSLQYPKQPTRQS